MGYEKNTQGTFVMRAVYGFINDNIPAILLQTRHGLECYSSAPQQRHPHTRPAHSVFQATNHRCSQSCVDVGPWTDWHAHAPLPRNTISKFPAQIRASPSGLWFLQQTSAHPVATRGAWVLPETISYWWPCPPLTFAPPQNGVASQPLVSHSPFAQPSTLVVADKSHILE